MGKMPIMRPKGKAETLEMRRQIAGRLLQDGKNLHEVSRLVGVRPGSVLRWKRMLEAEGEAGLKTKPHPVRPTRLSQEQKEKLEEILREGPLANGFTTDLWTLARVAHVIERKFGVKYHPGHVWYILRDMNWSPQKPEKRARERNEVAIEQWRKADWERVKKKPKRNT
jgi:transposase